MTDPQSKSEQRRRAVQGATAESDENRDVGRVDLDALDLATSTVTPVQAGCMLRDAYPTMRDELRELRVRPPFPTPGKIAAMEAELQELRERDERRDRDAGHHGMSGPERSNYYELLAARRVVEAARVHRRGCTTVSFDEPWSGDDFDCPMDAAIAAYDKVVKGE